MNRKKCFAFLGAVLIAMGIPISSYGAGMQKEKRWFYEENQIDEKIAGTLGYGMWY
jgi:hypothetical protein